MEFSSLIRIKKAYTDYIWSDLRNRRLVIQLLVIALVSSVCAFCAPAISGLIINSIEEGSKEKLAILCLASVSIALFGCLVGLFQSLVVSQCSSRVSLLMKSALFNASIRKQTSFFREYKYGEILYRIFNDSPMVAEKMTTLPVSLCTSGLFLLVALASICLINPIMAGFVFAMLVVNTVLNLVMQKKGMRLSRKVQELGEGLYSLSQEQLQNHLAIELFCTFENESQKNYSAMGDFADLTVEKNYYFGRSGAFLSCINSAWSTGILFIGGLSIIGGSMSLGSLVYCLMLMNLLMPFSKSIQEAILYLPSYTMMLNRYRELLNYPELSLSQTGLGFDRVCGDICFNGVTFAYPGSRNEVFRDYSGRAALGKLTFVVGRSGIGKSTLLKLLLRLEEPDQGSITIGGVDIKELELRDLRRHIRYAGSDTQLFSGTLEENLLYGSEGADESQIAYAIMASALSDVIDRLPDGTRTYLGRNGIALSEGEKQRVLIARSLVSQPSILLLDEATANVDSKTEDFIYERLKSLPWTCTIVSVSHRREILKYADSILRLSECDSEESWESHE